ncbi:MAG: 50S ribosomal protein L5 [Firmicutes bacterium]|nr:50S ribosomal protein L5 [Bacillota bacterium]
MEEVKVKASTKTTAKPVAKSSASKPKGSAPKRVFHNRLHEKYITEIVPALTEKFGNVNAVPRLEKIILNMGLGDVKDDTKKFNAAVDELGIITNQKAVVTKAKKSISNFKLREGQRIGAKVTLRGKYMYLFLDKLISVALPRVRDFAGCSTKSFDKFGNYAMGIKEQLVFPEIIYDKVEKVRGFDIAIVTTANTREDSMELLKALGFPFRKDNK